MGVWCAFPRKKCPCKAPRIRQQILRIAPGKVSGDLVRGWRANRKISDQPVGQRVPRFASWKNDIRRVIRSVPMFQRLFLRKLLSHWLLAALLLQSLMPAIAGAHGTDSARWIEVCVSSGVKWVPMADDSGPVSSHSASDHCALCAATGAAPEFDARPYLAAFSTFPLPSPPDRTLIRTFTAFHQLSRAPPAGFQ